MIKEYCDTTQLSTLKRAHILFTDEFPVELNPQPNRQNTRIRTNDKSKVPVMKRPKFPFKIMVAGGISRYGLSDLHVAPQGRTVNGQYYREEILPLFEKTFSDNGIFPDQKLSILMQDGATLHTAGSTMCQREKIFNDVWKD